MAKAVRTAIILAAGEGKRFKPLSKYIPKELLPLGTKPILGWILEEFASVGVVRTILVSSRAKPTLNEYFFDTAGELGLKRPTVVYQDRPLGTGDALMRVRDEIGGLIKGSFFLYYGDDVLVPVPEGLTRAQQLLKAYMTFGAPVVSLYKVVWGVVDRFGIADIEIDLENGMYALKGVLEKPDLGKAPSNLALVSGMILNSEIFRPLQRLLRERGGREVYLTHALAQIPVLYGVELRGEWIDVGTLRGYPDAFVRFMEAGSRMEAGK